MADIGYGYTKSNIQYMAADFARSVWKEVKSEKGLSDSWFYGFLKRWPDLKMVKPLRDRTRCSVGLDAKSGSERFFTVEEEKELSEHVKYMADIGYGYTKSNIQYMAADFARSVWKEVKSEKGLSDSWFYGFLKRWPDLKMVKPQKLQISRAKSASKEAVDNYFRELGNAMRENNLMEAPQRIYNLDETGISIEHAPPKIVYSKESNPQAVTFERSANITIIAGVNAIGNYIYPFYVFYGKRWMDELLEGAPTGSIGTLSGKG